MTPEQEELVIANLGLVHKTIMIKYPKFSDRSELESVGYLGLVKAALKYDKNKHPNVTFKTYAYYCIQWDMQTYLRSIDPLSKRERDTLNRTGELISTIRYPKKRRGYTKKIKVSLDMLALKRSMLMV